MTRMEPQMTQMARMGKGMEPQMAQRAQMGKELGPLLTQMAQKTRMGEGESSFCHGYLGADWGSKV